MMGLCCSCNCEGGCVVRCYSCNCDGVVLPGVTFVTVMGLCCQVLQL